VPSIERPARATLALTVAVALSVAACADATPSATRSDPPAPTSPAPMPSAASGSPSPAETAAIDLPAPGRPYDARAILEAMAASRRPGGVPAQLQAPDVAAAVAERIWTFDGDPWEVMIAGGSCGPQTCTLELSGAGSGAAGEDLYVFGVEPAGASVETLEASLHALPEDLLPRLDQLARSTVEDLPGDVVLATTRWLPPPDDGRFALAYRSGGEEGSCRIDLVLDARAGVVLSSESAGC
jgi:hypothetical protein